MGPEALAQVLRPLIDLFPAADYPDVLVGLDGADDAAVVRLDATTALIATTDFFPPIVDDAYEFGAIAAANAMSDVFAMGGEVLLALNLLALPDNLDPAIGAQIVLGGAEKVREAGGIIGGGHSVVDREPKYGLAVIGRVHPERVLRKAGARVGDVLVLTKPLGTGLITTALKQGEVSSESLAAAVASMMRLNREAGRAAGACGAHAATDITGFGLAGHGLEMAEQSGVALQIELNALPLLPGTLDYAGQGFAPGGTGRNWAAYADRIGGLDQVDETWVDVLFDPQTSGGLLVALPPERVSAFQAAIAADDADASIIGAVTAGSGIQLVQR